jgi:hypothetical protein
MREMKRAGVFFVLGQIIAFPLSLEAAQVPYLPVYGGPETWWTGRGEGEPVLMNKNGTVLGLEFHSSTMTGDMVFWNAPGASVVTLKSIDANSTCTPYAMNDSGTAVGFLKETSTTPVYQASRWEASTGNPTTLSDSTNSLARVINNSGVSAGFIDGDPVRWDASGTTVTVLQKLGTPPPTGYFPASNTTGINAAGTITGYIGKFDAAHNSLGSRAVYWDGAGIVTELGGLGESASHTFDSTADAINNAGTIVGTAEKYVNGEYKGNRPVRWNAGSTTATELDSMNDDSGFFPRAINDAGTIIGNGVKYNGSAAGEIRAVRWDAGGTAITELGDLGATGVGYTSIRAFAINNGGIVVGNVETFDNTYQLLEDRAVYWGPNGACTDLNTLIDPASGWFLLSAQAVNDNGWIAGYGRYDSDGPSGNDPIYRLYVLHIPEPATMGLLVLGGLLVRRRS